MHEILLILMALPVVIVAIQFILGPNIVRRCLYFHMRPGVRLLQPNVSKLPPRIHAFFAFVWEQMKPLGFEPAAYFKILQQTPDFDAVVFLLRNVVAGDRAAALCILKNGPSYETPAAMTVEFSTICENGKLVDTTDMADISPLRKSVRKSTWKIPQIKSISTLYQAHREHLRVIGSCGILTSVTPQEAIDECMTESHREFEEQVQLGGMVTDRSNLRYYLSWPQAVWGTWKLVWPVRQVLRARIFAESRKRLRKFGLVHNRQRADYIAVFDSLRSSADIPPLPEVE